MYIDELKAKVSEMAIATGNHKSWCANQVAKSADFAKFAEEVQTRRALSNMEALHTGYARSGVRLSEKDMRELKSDSIALIAAEIQ